MQFLCLLYNTSICKCPASSCFPFHSTYFMPVLLCLPFLSHTSPSKLSIFFFFLCFFFSPLWKCSPFFTSTSLSLHFRFNLSIVFPRAYLSVIWRMGLQHRGQGAWCSGCHCYSNLHHDSGPGATHPAEVKLPWDTRQKGLQHRPFQGNPKVSHCCGDSWSGGQSSSEGMGCTYTHSINWNYRCKMVPPNSTTLTLEANCEGLWTPHTSPPPTHAII